MRASDLVTHKEIAPMLAEEEGTTPLTVSRVQQIETAALKKVRAGLVQRGVDAEYVADVLRAAFNRTSTWDKIQRG